MSTFNSESAESMFRRLFGWPVPSKDLPHDLVEPFFVSWCSVCQKRLNHERCSVCLQRSTELHRIWTAFRERGIDDEPDPIIITTNHLTLTTSPLTAFLVHHPKGKSTRSQAQQYKRLQLELLQWINKKSRWSQDNPTPAASAFARYGVFCTPELTDDAYHPQVLLNIQPLKTVPKIVSDKIAAITQEFIGYFHGQIVISGQMHNLDYDALGNMIDPSVKTAGLWHEPFEPIDDCQFCVKLTNEKIRRRIDGFQWAMDKELAYSVGHLVTSENNYPRKIGLPENREEREKFRREQVAWEQRNPKGLHAYYLHDLPWHLQRTMVIKWNHVWRDWLRDDLRVDYIDGTFFYLYHPQLWQIEPILHQSTRSFTQFQQDTAWAIDRNDLKKIDAASGAPYCLEDYDESQPWIAYVEKIGLENLWVEAMRDILAADYANRGSQEVDES